MKTFPFRQLSAALFLIGGLAGPLFAAADGDAASAEDKAKTAIPATSAEIWTSIDTHVADLDKVVASGALGDVHHHAFAVRDLVAALPEHSKALPADKLAKVQGNLKYVATLAKRLDQAGDANDKAATQSGITQLKKVLAGIRANY